MEMPLHPSFIPPISHYCSGFLMEVHSNNDPTEMQLQRFEYSQQNKKKKELESFPHAHRNVPEKVLHVDSFFLDEAIHEGHKLLLAAKSEITKGKHLFYAHM